MCSKKLAYLANAGNSCAICNGPTHTLYVCKKFRSLSHDQRIAAVKSNQLCFNCLKLGHHKLQCPVLHRCQVCQRPHHTLLHLDDDEDAPDAPTTAGRAQSTEVTLISGCDVRVIDPAFACCKPSTTQVSGGPHDLPGKGHDFTGYHDAGKSVA